MELLEGRHHLARLETRLLVQLHLRAEGAVLPGMGVEPGTPIKMAFKVKLPGWRAEKPIVLATTLKGALRALSERLAKASPDAFASSEAEKKAIELHVEPQGKPIQHRPEEGEFKPEELGELLEALGLASVPAERAADLALMLGMQPEDAGELREQKAKTLADLLKDEAIRRLLSDLVERSLALHCPICRLYGSPSLAGKLRLVDALPEGDDVRTRMRVHVGIDRRSLTAAENILYYEEVVEPGVAFTTYIVVDNLRPGTPEGRLLASTLDAILKLHLQLGASKSRGLGLLKVDEERSRAWFCDFSRADEMRAAELLTDPRRGEEFRLRELVRWLMS